MKLNVVVSVLLNYFQGSKIGKFC